MTTTTLRDVVGATCPACQQPDTRHRTEKHDGMTAVFCPDGRLLVEGDWSAKSCTARDPMAWAQPETRKAARQMMLDYRPYRRAELARVPDPAPWLKDLPPESARRIKHLEALYDRNSRDWRKVQQRNLRWYAERRQALMAAGMSNDEAYRAYPSYLT